MITIVLFVAALVSLGFASFSQTTTFKGVSLFPLGMLLWLLAIVLPLLLK